MSIVEPNVSEISGQGVIAVEAVERPRERRGNWRRHGLVWAALVIVVGGAIWAGLPTRGSLRHWVFEQTRPIRFREDPARGFSWGREALDKGFLNLYGTMRGQAPSDQRWLDVPPLRLAVMTLWAHTNARRFPGVDAYQNTFEFARPVMWANAAVELFGAVGMFLLVRHWVVRHARNDAGHAHGPDEESGANPFAMYRGVATGLVAALLLWFNPAVLLSAYGWTSADAWLIPFYIWAVYLASVERWFLAGMVVATGAMFKGQMLAVAGLFVVWPLVSGWPRAILGLVVVAVLAMALRIWEIAPLTPAGRVSGAAGGWVFLLCVLGIVPLILHGARWSAVWRWASGFVLGVGLIVSPWMLRHAGSGKLNVIATGWVAATFQWTLAAMLAVYCIRRWGLPFGDRDATAHDTASRVSRWLTVRSAGWGVGVLLVAAITLCDWLLTGRLHWRTLLLASGAGLGAVLVRTARQRAVLLGGVAGVSLLLCMPLFHASDAWYVSGWKFGTRHFNRLVVGLPDNVPALLTVRYGYDDGGPDHVVFDIPAKTQFGWPGEAVPVTLRTLMRAIFVATALPCMVAAAVQFRRSDKRFLVAITTPWLLFFLLPLQIHERYSVFVAGVGACLVAAGLGPALLHGFLSLSACVMMLGVLLKPEQWNALASENPDSLVVRYGEVLRTICGGAHPDLAWAILLAAMILFYLSIVPSDDRNLSRRAMNAMR